ncbi:MAG TPA: hypothetical protein VIL74_20695 [Pyrinomonadaceae bacterium]
MRALTREEIEAIKKEFKRHANADEAIKFCLGHHKLDYWHYEARQTFERVKRQVLAT